MTTEKILRKSTDTPQTSKCGRCGKVLDVSGFRTLTDEEVYVCKSCHETVAMMSAMLDKLTQEVTHH